LKKEEQIEALAMIMVLCLLVYSFAEWVIRKGLFAPQDSGMVHRHLSSSGVLCNRMCKKRLDRQDLP